MQRPLGVLKISMDNTKQGGRLWLPGFKEENRNSQKIQKYWYAIS